MLHRTFCHLPGITLKSERVIWNAGILSWDFAERAKPGLVGESVCAVLQQHIPLSRKAIRNSDLAFFVEHLPVSEHWRVFREFRDKTVYLDIETTGMGRGTDHITTIVAYDGLNVEHFVHGVNLDQFPGYMKSVELVVTYNGKCFDLPFIQREFRSTFNPVHLDLRYILKSVGIQGGLKKCERQVGLDRGELSGVDGYTAVLLWREYRRAKNRRALETLLAYNYLDVLNLEPLMITAYNRKMDGLPCDEERRIEMPQWQPSSPFLPDPELVARLQGTPSFQRSW